MSNANPTRIGQIDAAGDPTALFLKVYAGETLSAFDRESAFRDKHVVRTIASGKSAQFPVFGRQSAFYHTPGQEILGNVIHDGERIITIDDMLIAPTFIANIDEAMSHFDVRGEYSHQTGQALAKVYDQDTGRVFVLAARSAPAIAELPAGAFQNNALFNSDGSVLWNGVFNAGVTLDQNDVPTSDRYAWFDPVRYALLVQSDRPMDRDYNPEGNGSVRSGKIIAVNNIPILKTNNMPNADDRANTAIAAGRRADYSVTRGIVGHRSAAGTVQLQDVTMEMAYDIRRQGTLLVGKYLVGKGVLRSEAAVELRTADPTP